MFINCSKTMATIKWVNNLIIISFIVFNVLGSISNGLSTVDERGPRKLFGGYRITPKFCNATKALPPEDPRSKGPTICMFNHECAQRDGEVVGACMDGFLFGACCQIPRKIENSLLQQAQSTQSSTHWADEDISIQQSTNNFKNNLPNNHIEEYNTQEIESSSPGKQNYSQFYVNQESVIISSPSTLHFQSEPSSTPSTVDNEVTHYQSTASPELHTQISTQHATYSSDSFEGSKPTQNMNTFKISNFADIDVEEFGHSDITHPEAESELLENDLQFPTGYKPLIYFSSTANQNKTSTTSIFPTSTDISTVYKDPNSEEKIPTANDEKYVLIQTLSNDKLQFKPSLEGITSSDIESIESIILMLNDTNHGPSYNMESVSQESNQVTHIYSPNRKPSISTITNNYNTHPTGGFYVTDAPSTLGISTLHSTIKNQHNKISNPSTILSHQSSTPSLISTPSFSSTTWPPKPLSVTTSRPNVYEKFSTSISYPSSTPSVTSTQSSTSSSWPAKPIFSSNNKPSTLLLSSSTTKRPQISNNIYKPQKPAGSNEVNITPTRRQPTLRPTKTPQSASQLYVVVPTRPIPSFIVKKPNPSYAASVTRTPRPPSTSYVTGPTTPRPRPTSSSIFSDSSTSAATVNKIQENTYSTTTKKPSTYLSSNAFVSSTQRPNVKVPVTQRPPSPTVIITPKPTVNIGSSSPWTKLPTATPSSTTVKHPTNSHIFNSIISSTERPDPISSTQAYLGLPTVVSNDFDDPGYFDEELNGSKRPYYGQLTTQALFTPRPPDDRPAFPGYYGPTPTFATFNIPVASEQSQFSEEETYTSPNDFVNFPPVRNPNLNLSATSSAVTYDLELSTPAFVEDDILKNKMNILVNKIVESLQGNFNVLTNFVEDQNNTVDRTTIKPATVTKKTTTLNNVGAQSTRRPSVTGRPIAPNKGSTQKPSATRKPTQTIKKPVPSKKPSAKPSTKPSTKPPPSVTKKPSTTRRPSKPTKKVPSTTVVQGDEEIQEHSEENNEISSESSTEGSRRFQCGIRPQIRAGKIVGGKGATFGEWPWQVLVRESTWLGLFTKNKCGGVLITNKFVITAAHCQPGFLASLVAVFGEFDISGDLEAKRAVTKNVKRVIVHRQYDAATFENDLALLELESPIHYDTHIVPICMPADTADFTGRMATVTGWGRLKYGGGVPSILQEVQVPIIENSVCQEMFHTAGHNKKILPSFLCAGYANGQKDSCEGDSGGPLVLQRDDGRWELAGTVSHGIKCAAPYLPGVYMRTTYYKPWLKSITGVK